MIESNKPGDPTTDKLVMPALERGNERPGELSTGGLMDPRIEALETEIGRILRMSPASRKELGFDLHLEILVKELHSLEGGL